MNQKIQKKYIQKALRILSKENSSKITTFKELAKAMKTTDKTIYTYSLNKCEKIIEILHKNSAEKKTEKIVKKLPRKNVKKRTKLPIKNDEDKRLRSYEEIKAKLFA